MGTFKAYWKKEMLESWRQYRYVVLALGFIIFAILDPVMIKLLPVILKSQIPPEMAGFMALKFTPAQAAVDYLSDLSQLIPLFVILGLMGNLADEIKHQKLVFPYAKGINVGQMIWAKYLHYVGFVALSALVGVTINWYYVNILFEGDKLALGAMLVAGALYAVFYCFGIALLFFVSSLFKNGIASAMFVLFAMLFMSFFGGVKQLAMFLPNTLTRQALQLGHLDGALVAKALVATLVYILVLQWLTVRRMKQVEVI